MQSIERAARLSLVGPGISQHERTITEHAGRGGQQCGLKPPQKSLDRSSWHCDSHWAAKSFPVGNPAPALYPALVRTDNFPFAFTRVVSRTLW